MFAKAGAKLYFTEQDCDDTIASWAYADKGCILSGDLDYYRYDSQDRKYNFYGMEEDNYKPFKVFYNFGYDRSIQKYRLFSGSN